MMNKRTHPHLALSPARMLLSGLSQFGHVAADPERAQREFTRLQGLQSAARKAYATNRRPNTTEADHRKRRLALVEASARK